MPFATSQRQVAVYFPGPPDWRQVQCLEQHLLGLPVESRRGALLDEEDEGYDRAKDARTCNVQVGYGMMRVSSVNGELDVVDKRQIILTVTLYHLGDLELAKTRRLTVKLEDEVADDIDGDPSFVGKSFDHLTGLLHAQPGPLRVALSRAQWAPVPQRPVRRPACLPPRAAGGQTCVDACVTPQVLLLRHEAESRRPEKTQDAEDPAISQHRGRHRGRHRGTLNCWRSPTQAARRLRRLAEPSWSPTRAGRRLRLVAGR